LGPNGCRSLATLVPDRKFHEVVRYLKESWILKSRGLWIGQNEVRKSNVSLMSLLKRDVTSFARACQKWV
jgi:hypothetical protein